MISKREAEEIRENFSPAFAGYLTDGNVSERDVLATLMDLIVKGHIGLEADTQKTPQAVKSIYLINSSSQRLLAFEKEFIKKLFKQRSKLSFGEVKEALLGGELEVVILDNISALKENKIVRAGIVFFDKAGAEVTDPYWSEVAKTLRTVGELEDYYSDYKREGQVQTLRILKGDVISLILGLDKLSKTARYEKLKAFMDFQFTETVMPLAKEKYADLFEYIKAAPLKTQRLHNEFMPFAVAFGLDTSWNASFEVPVERVEDPRKSILRKPKSACPKCGAVVLDDPYECSACRHGLRDRPHFSPASDKAAGYPFDWEYECDKCGARVPKNNKVCGKCGDYIDERDAPIVFKV